MTDRFEMLHQINDFIVSGEVNEARNQIIRMLHELEDSDEDFPPPLNHFIRTVGLYPYINLDTANWQERYIYETFKVDVGGTELTLHREQSTLLKKLVDGGDLAVSAPTSFGKSFVIDSFIALRKPKNVVIIVPTIALTDETRRRIQKKFGQTYKIITTTEATLEDNNILIFPQERAAHYTDKLESIDMLVIDEFYKASKAFDKERSSSLLRTILNLGKKSKQRYFLAPNINRLNDSVFTIGMEFISLDFNTVYLEKHNLYEYINDETITKSDALLDVLNNYNGKTLIYAGTYSCINELSNLLVDSIERVESPLLKSFSDWLVKNYDRNWELTNLIKRGCGIHNGKLHRSLSQIQVKLFEEPGGLNNIVSTSSIIEGVNTSAANVVLWRNKNGQRNLNDFTYKNIIGRGGRMFQHFVGRIFLLEKPPQESENQLDLEFSDDLVSGLNEADLDKQLTPEQIAKIISYKEEMSELLGAESFNRLQSQNVFSDSDSSNIVKISKDIIASSDRWSGLGYLNSDNPDDWESSLFSLLDLMPGSIGTSYSKFVAFIKIISRNWELDIHQLLLELSDYDIGINDFFELERNASFKFSSFLKDFNAIQQEVFGENSCDISPFIAKLSHVFLPPLVYSLEEYGLPRMISKKIADAELLNLESLDTELHDILTGFRTLGFSNLISRVDELDDFDLYILEYFYDGLG